MRKSPYTRALVSQVLEIPFQLLHHLRRSQPVVPPEKHRFGPAWRQYLLAWWPDQAQITKNSVVILYHGGGWRVGWPALHPTLAEFFLREGFPVIMPAYRLAPWAGHRQMREDLSLALGTTLRLLQERGLGDKKILMAGMSAGATLAAHLVFDRAELERIGVAQSLFSGFVSFAGPLDLGQMPGFRAVHDYAGGKSGSAAFQVANPLHYIAGDEQIPVLMMHGTVDAIVPFGCSESFFQIYPGPKILYALPGKTHLDSLRFATDDVEAAKVLRQWLADK